MTGQGQGWEWPVARVVEVHDADTIKLDVDCGFSLHAHAWIRLLDVRAPELSEPTGAEAKAVTLGWVINHAPDSRVRLVTFRTSQPLEMRFRGSFVRYLGVVTGLDGDVLNAYLRIKGYTDQGM